MIRDFLDDQKLKKLGWQERTSWEEGLKMTMEWNTKNSDWWGDVSAALSPHPNISVMTYSNDDALFLQSQNCKNRMEGHGTDCSRLKFLIYGRTGWIGGLLGNLCLERDIVFEYGRGRLEDRR